MAVGLFALFDPITVPAYFNTGIAIILGAAAVYFLLIAVLGRLQRFLGFGFLGAYAVFAFQGIVR
jgi:cation:H+ antiporter